MRFVRRYLYRVCYWLVVVAMGLLHFPLFRGRENLPKGAAILCPNHSGLADPVWVVLAAKEPQVPWIMAKKSVMEKPIIGPFLAAWGAYGVDRDNPDIHAVKKSLTELKNGEKLIIFPEGTRVKKGKTVTPKSGAVMLAHRAGVPLVPVYITPNRKPFQPVRVIMGEAYSPRLESRRPTAEELEAETEILMKKIYALGEKP